MDVFGDIVFFVGFVGKEGFYDVLGDIRIY